MMKRLVAIVCALALIAVLIPTGTGIVALAAEEGKSYQVGYSKKDVTPYIKNPYTGDLGIDNIEYADADKYVGTVQIHNPNNTAEIVEIPFVKTPLSGYGAITTRLADKMTDDNGDGLIGLGDGIFVTATVVTDDWGNTVIYMTTDLINGFSYLTSAVRNAIVAAIGADKIKPEQIILTGSHTHEGPTLSNCYTSWNSNMNTANSKATGDVTALGSYWLYFVDQMTAAAVEAYENRSAATMTKGEIEAPDAMKAMGYTYKDSNFDNNGEGFMLNSVRHYDVKKTVRTVVEEKMWYHTSYKQTSDTTTTYNWVGGDNFGAVNQPGTTTKTTESTSGSSFSKKNIKTTVTTTYETDHVSEVNDTMSVLRFDRAEGDPIVLINWRAHASICGGSPYTNISSDYINALRYRLENNTSFGGNQNYCVGFWQSNSGNVNNTSRLNYEYKYVPADHTTGVGYTTITLDDNKDGKDDVKVPWEKDATGFYADYYKTFTNGSGTENYTDQVHRCALYGYLLGKVALYTMENGMTTGLDHGKIRAIQSDFMAPTRQYTAGEIAAATQWKADYDAGKSITYPYHYTYNGSDVAMNSYYHAYSIVHRSSAEFVKMELHAVVMGKDFALVTGPGEQFDRYSSEHTTGNTSDNDWDDLIGSYGKPFILSYSNDSTGYSPNQLAYNYYTDQNGKVPVGTAMGSYEANTTTLAEGVGESLIPKFSQMIDLAANGYVERYCEHCKKTVEWTPLTAENAHTDIGSGHYYLLEDLNGTTYSGSTTCQWGVGADGLVENICFDLNGHAKTSITRNFIVKKDSVLSIMDSVGGGYVQGQTYSNNPGGGNISVETGGVLNLYSGTLKFKKIDNESWYGTGVGGVISLSGTFNMYGGTVEGGEVVTSSYTFGNNGCGGAIYVYPNGKVNAYGGSITSGAVPDTGRGPCVFLADKSSKLLLSGDAKVEDIYFNVSDTSASLEVSGAYTGTSGLTFRYAISNGKDIGTATEVDLSNANITCTNNSNANIAVTGSNLVLSFADKNAIAIVSGSEGLKYYNSLEEAVNAYKDGMIKLVKDDDSSVHITKDLYLDLNGNSVRGEVVIDEHSTLYCKDTQTDDYTVADDNYGRIAEAYGNVCAMQDGENTYMLILEDDGMSFHRVNLDIYAMSLRPEVNGVIEPGVYYKSDFAGDEVVASYVDTFGIALSVAGMPNAENMDTVCKYSYFSEFQSGEGANDATGTLLKGIMKGRNSDQLNTRNAEVSVYGRAYIKDISGNYIFGVGVSRSLRQQIELIDEQWDTVGENQEAVVTLCKKYETVVSKWTIPNIRRAAMEGMGATPETPKFNNNNLVFTSGNKAVCPACQKEVEWTAITQEAYGSTEVPQQNVDGVHFYLAEDITYTGEADFITGPGGGKKLCIHLNGHNFTGTKSRFLFGYGSNSYVMGNGIVATGKNTSGMGGIAWNTNTQTNISIHLYGGTYTVTADNTKGSAIAIQDNGGQLHIHEGVKVIGSKTASAIYVGTSNLRTSELYVTGATIEGSILIKNRAVDKGFSTTVVIDDSEISKVELGKDVSCIIAGNTGIDKLTVAEGAKFVVGQLGLIPRICVQGNGVVSEPNANMAAYLNCFTASSGELWIEDNALVIG